MDNDYISALQQEFKAVSNSKIAAVQKAYLRNQFSFYGMKSPVRREAQKPFLVKQFLPAKENLDQLVRTLWQKPQREFHYFAQELVQKYCKQFEKDDILLLEFMVVTNSWWDTVDFIATSLIGSYFKKFPDQINPVTKKWMVSENIWLQRSCLLFQLKWKKNIDPVFLEQTINELIGSKEFFINKAIGWILRQYSRTNQDWVIDYVDRTELNSLSKREALKLIS
ncbi:DNA alkylation repair protein [Aurantibacter crassamenti]|uniref:DNA alkylation repair protein n=1 Tax=Aurantibacter crassamenti TaxID=1837375 RepID=UPI0019395200|nr:DNA alkylation repair protein [Aurantibacter crassamenti]MBM1104813.1 DNA alkylation repair protein [Aurantibacter crassamenti]